MRLRECKFTLRGLYIYLQVPIDKPFAAHDLLLRFMGIETLTAAGDASRIASRLGSATNNGEAVIGKIAPDGGTLPAVISQQEEAAAAAASSAAAAVDLADTLGQPVDKERELLYGPRRSAVLVLIIVTVILTLYALLRWRARQRRLKGWQPRTSLARHGLVHSSSAQSLNRWSGGHGHGYGNGGTPTSATTAGKAKRFRDSISLSDVNLFERMEGREAEDRDGYGHGGRDDGMDEVARTVFAIDEESEAEGSGDDDPSQVQRRR